MYFTCDVTKTETSNFPNWLVYWLIWQKITKTKKCSSNQTKSVFFLFNTFYSWILAIWKLEQEFSFYCSHAYKWCKVVMSFLSDEVIIYHLIVNHKRIFSIILRILSDCTRTRNNKQLILITEIEKNYPLFCYTRFFFVLYSNKDR